MYLGVSSEEYVWFVCFRIMLEWHEAEWIA